MNENIKVITRQDGTKIYPIGSVYKYQHVIMNFYDRMGVKKEFTEHEQYIKDVIDNHLLEVATQGTYLGMYYSEYKYREAIMEVINGYIDRHGGEL